MNRKNLVIISIILLVGILYRLISTANGSFIFNMDNARDMVDVREMVVSQKIRLTGPTSAIDGFFNGPGWYYLLAVPFVVSGGDPYYSILMEIGLWAMGGFFLLKLVSRWSVWLVVPIGAIWIASDYIVLANLYAFNPNPVTLLSPLFIYLLVEYLEKRKAIYGILTWLLGGLFFNFEMNFGVFIPLIIFVSIFLTKNVKLIKQKWFWLGVFIFALSIFPQIIFDFKHQFIMSQAILKHLDENFGSNFNILARFQTISADFYNVFVPVLMNRRILAVIILLLLLFVIFGFLKQAKKEILPEVCLVYIFVPFLGYLVLPVTVNPWHLGGEMVALVMLIGYMLKRLTEKGFLGKTASLIISGAIILFTLSNIGNFFLNDLRKPNLDPSLYGNEIAAIDYVYQYAKDKNFRVYTYLPSVYDYPYQYLIWWYGLKRYGYLPLDYAYAPNKPEYISNKWVFSATEDQIKKRANSNLVFLIKEPDRNYTRSGWEGEFVNLKTVNKEMVGPLEIEIKRE